MKANATDEQALQLKKKFLDEEFQWHWLYSFPCI